ncbi:MAG: Fe-S cluster assembly protein SufD [Alphaproteobacteria bacterium]|nr:Fe-S cluster assembly protein SufD [Alphaproteobacteria bacterium]
MFAKQKYIPDDTLQTQFAAMPVASSPWLAKRRTNAVAGYQGYPTTALENWKFTNVKPMLMQEQVSARPNQGDISAALEQLDALPAGYRVVFVNGVFHTALSELPKLAGVEIQSLAQMLEHNAGHLEAYYGRLSEKYDNSFAQANLVLAQDGLAIRIEESVVLDQPIIVGHIFTGGAQALQCHSRNVYVLKAGAQAEIVEMQIGVPDAMYIANTTSEIFLGGAAQLRHSFIQNESDQGASIQSRYIWQEKRSQFHGVALTTGAWVNRIETQITLGGIESHAAQHTVQLLRENRHSDSMTHVVHDTPEATSNQHCRMILNDSAKGAFQGKTTVKRDAQKTDAHQLNKNLLLSRNAKVDSKPELEIYADDVKCAHGATTGELDEMALFYMQSRGIEPDVAKQLLVEAFADEVIEQTPLDDAMKAVLRRYVAQWMMQQ